MQITSKFSIGKTLFSLVYGYEAFIYTEVLLPTLKSGAKKKNKKENHAMDLILMEERREKAMIKMKSQKMSI